MGFRGGVVLVLISPLKLSVSIHEMFTGKIGHLTIIKFKKKMKIRCFFFLHPIFYKISILNTAFLTIHFVKKFKNFEI